MLRLVKDVDLEIVAVYDHPPKNNMLTIAFNRRLSPREQVFIQEATCGVLEYLNTHEIDGSKAKSEPEK